ncbi:hypothetical protein Bca4012_015838 [Brassica carinata]
MVYKSQSPPSSDPSPPPSGRFLGITSTETPSNNHLETKRLASNLFKLGSQRQARSVGEAIEAVVASNSHGPALLRDGENVVKRAKVRG